MRIIFALLLLSSCSTTTLSDSWVRTCQHVCKDNGLLKSIAIEYSTNTCACGNGLTYTADKPLDLNPVPVVKDVAPVPVGKK